MSSSSGELGLDCGHGHGTLGLGPGGAADRDALAVLGPDGPAVPLAAAPVLVADAHRAGLGADEDRAGHAVLDPAVPLLDVGLAVHAGLDAGGWRSRGRRRSAAPRTRGPGTHRAAPRRRTPHPGPGPSPAAGRPPKWR